MLQLVAIHDSPDPSTDPLDFYPWVYPLVEGLAKYVVEVQKEYGFAVALLRYVVYVETQHGAYVAKYGKGLLLSWLTDHPYSHFEFRVSSGNVETPPK